jgi:hypothetical protein
MTQPDSLSTVDIQENLPDEALIPPATKRFRGLRRVGCVAALVLWFGFILLPIFLLALAIKHEITISQGCLPAQQIRVWLVMERDQRGIGFSRTSTSSYSAAASAENDTTSADGVCLQTNVRYILWQGQGTASTYCACYSRSDSESEWVLIDSVSGNCPG